jgi:hypothetical protein
MSKIKVNEIEKASGSGITVPTGTSFTVVDGIGVAGGGTGLTSFTAGDLLYATGSTTLAKLPKGTASQTLKMNSGASAPEWATVAAATSDMVKLATTTVTSGVASVAFEHGTGDIDFTSSTYAYHKVYFKDVHMAGDNERIYFTVRLQSSGSYLTGGTDYREVRVQMSGSSRADLHNDQSSARIFGGGTDTGRTNYSTMQGELTLMNFSDTNNYSVVGHHTYMSHIDSTTNDFMSIGAHFIRNHNQHDGIKFAGTGNIDRGVFTLYGIK